MHRLSKHVLFLGSSSSSSLSRVRTCNAIWIDQIGEVRKGIQGGGNE
jgi:hypothetical protein